MKKQEIQQIEYRWGMINSVKEASSLPKKIWRGSDIPNDILLAIKKENLLELGGKYGNEFWGDPIEYNQLRIISDKSVIEIEFFNLGIAMFKTDDDVTKRIFRVLAKLKHS